jgi:hypothetical protein
MLPLRVWGQGACARASSWFRVGNLKTAAGREKKIAAFVKMLKRGESLHPPK